MNNLNFSELPSATSAKSLFIAKLLMPVSLIFILIAVFSSVNSFAYTPPIGITNPSVYFGTFGEIDQPTPNSATKCPSWPSAPTMACYYIDKTSTACTNTNNTYGYPNKPRCLPPEGLLSAGSYVYIHAGTYTASDSASPDGYSWHGAGTASNPIWITGNASKKPVFTDRVYIGLAGSASYVILENIMMSGGRGIEVTPYVNNAQVDHVIIRNCVLTGTGSTGDSGGIAVGYSGSDYYPASSIKYVVVHNNIISHYGLNANPGTEQCGVYAGFHTDATWVLNNEIFDMGSSGVAGCHNADFITRNTKNVFIGGNKIYANGERCIMFKAVDGGVISQNTCTGPAAREQGVGFGLAYGASETPNRNVLVQYNTIYNVGTGIFNGGSHGCDNCSYIGNRFSNVNRTYALMYDPAFTGWAIQIGGSHGITRVADNTCYNCERGIVSVEYLSLTGTDVLINERNTVSTVPLDLNSLSITTTSSTPSTTVSGTTTTTPPTTEPTTTTTVIGTTTPTTTIPITTSSTTPRWNKKIKLFRR